VEDIEIRAARRDELSEIVTLYNLMWVDSDPLDHKLAENIFDEMQGKPNQGMYVAETGGRVVASFMMLINDGGECVVENVVVHPKFQRHGIGKRMMSFVADRCRETGCRRLVISSAEKRESSSGFYESLGFRRMGYGFVKDFD
jgi:ribosomal protein S18 acetylase RimI-like enzyme